MTTVTATDPNGDQPTYTITGGTDASLFGFTSAAFDPQRAAELRAALRRRRQPRLRRDLRVSDGHGGTDTQAIAVTVANVAEPTVGGDTLSYVVNGTGNSQTVKLTDAAIFDGDLATAANPLGQASPAYQWQFSTTNGATWTAGSTAANYTPTGANIGRPVHVVATYTDAFGSHTVTSQAAVIGSASANTLQGTAEADLLIGLNGNDTYTVDNAGDQVIEIANGGTDKVQTTLTAYSLAALTNVENLTFAGTGTSLAPATCSKQHHEWRRQ